MRIKNEDLLSCHGKIVSKAKGRERDSDIYFFFEDGSKLIMRHDQDCCENVTLEDVCGGKLSDLNGEEIVSITEDTNGDTDTNWGIERWTFYTIKTPKRTLTLRWHGESNGYYSVGVKCYFKEAENGTETV